MANSLLVQMSDRTRLWRGLYEQNRTEVRHFGRYAVYFASAWLAARAIVAAGQHVAVLMPAALVAGLLLSAVELALSAVLVILAAIGVTALLVLPASMLVRQIRTRLT